MALCSFCRCIICDFLFVCILFINFFVLFLLFFIFCFFCYSFWKIFHLFLYTSNLGRFSYSLTCLNDFAWFVLLMCLSDIRFMFMFVVKSVWIMLNVSHVFWIGCMMLVISPFGQPIKACIRNCLLDICATSAHGKRQQLQMLLPTWMD